MAVESGELRVEGGETATKNAKRHEKGDRKIADRKMSRGEDGKRGTLIDADRH